MKTQRIWVFITFLAAIAYVGAVYVLLDALWDTWFTHHLMELFGG